MNEMSFTHPQSIQSLFKELSGIVVICIVIANLTSILLSDPYHPFYDLGLILKATVLTSPSTKFRLAFSDKRGQSGLLVIVNCFWRTENVHLYYTLCLIHYFVIILVKNLER